MRSIPDEVLLKMGAMRPHMIAQIDAIHAHPERATELERIAAYEFLGGDVGPPLTAQEVFRLAASSAGHPYGQYIDLDYAAGLCALSPDHLRRLCIDGKLTAIKWRGQWYVDRDALPVRQRQPRQDG